MKKSILLIITLVMTILFLCACGDEIISATETPSPTETPPVIETLAPTEEKYSILDAAVALNSGSLFSIPNALIESSLQVDIARFGDDILAWSYRYGEQGSEMLLSIIDSSDGSITAQRALEGLGQANVQICGSSVVICDWSDGNLYILDDTLHTEQLCALGIDSAFYADPELDFVYVFMSDKGIFRMPLFSYENGQYVLENVSTLYPSTSNGKQVSFSCIDDSTGLSTCGVLDLNGGTVKMLPFEGSFATPEYFDGLWLADIFGEDGKYMLGSENFAHEFQLERGSFAELLSEQGRILVKSYDQSGNVGLSLYAADGSYISACSVEGAAGGLGSEPVWFEELGGYFFTITVPEGSDRLLFWDISKPTAGENLALSSIDALDNAVGSSVSAALYERANDISEKYGIEIRIAELCGSEFAEYSIEKEYSEYNISAALDAVERVFLQFPKGFFDGFNYGVYRSTELHLAGELQNTDIESGDGVNFTSFVGFTTQQDSRHIMVLDIRRAADLIERTLFHELSHVIDKRLEFDSNMGKGNFSEDAWARLNPDGFAYFESYTALPASVLTDGFDSYFIDIYSRTYPGEDRARIFEYASAGDNWAFSSAPGRLAKLEYYSHCIRESFGGDNWITLTPWEITLNNYLN